MMIKQIQSSQFFQIVWLRLVFIVATIFSVIAVALLIVYASVRKQKLLPNGAIAYKPLNPAILYTSITSSLCALFGYVTCVVQYIRIFNFSLTPMFYLLTASSVISIVILSLNVYYLLRPGVCESGFILDTTLNQCVPDCPIGKKLDYTTQTCIPGCVSKDDCIGGTQCVSGECCKYVTDINCGDTCCDPQDCQDGQVCCPKDKYCDDGVCCGEIGGCVDGHCRVYCPDADHTCEPGQACFSFDSLSTPNPNAYVQNGKAYMCSTISDKCQPDSNPQFIPRPVGDTSLFYPAAGLPSGETGADIIDKSLKNFGAVGDISGQIIDELLGNDPNSGHLGAYCGATLATPIRIVSEKHITGDGQCSLQSCLDYAYPNITTNVSAVTDDKGYLWCNMILDQDYGVSSKKGASEYTAAYYDNRKPVKTTYPMKGSDPVKRVAGDSYYTFQKDCNVFGEDCPTYDAKNVKCEQTDNIGWFDRVETGTNFCTIPFNATADDYQTTTVCSTVSSDRTDIYNNKGYMACNDSADKCSTTKDQLQLNPDIAYDADFQKYGYRGVCWTSGNNDKTVCYNDGLGTAGPDYFKNDIFYPGNTRRRPCQIGGFIPILRTSPGWHANSKNEWFAYLEAFCCDPIALQKNLESYGISLEDIAGSPNGDSVSTDTIDTVMKLSCGPPAPGNDGQHNPIIEVLLGNKVSDPKSCVTDNYSPPDTLPGRDNCLGGFISTIKEINDQNMKYSLS